MTARLGSEYRYFGKLVLVPFRYFSIDIYRNIDIFDNTTRADKNTVSSWKYVSCFARHNVSFSFKCILSIVV